MQTPIHYADLAGWLAQAGYPDEPSSFHGALCGALCVTAPERVQLARLLEAGSDAPLQPAAPVRQTLQHAVEDAYLALLSSEMAFAPLLPPDETALPRRIAALASWCEGFLYGLAGEKRLDLEKSSEEVREIIEDLAQFTQAGVDAENDDELEEQAYAELVEYVRVGAQLVFMELHPRPAALPSPDADPAPTVH